MRGGTSGSLTRVQTCMYVCWSSQTFMYVCMFRLHVCMYVCLKPSCVYVCMYVRSPSWAGIYVCMYDWEHLHYICMYVSGDKRCMYVCLKHTYIESRKEASLPKRSSLSMYVCFKTLCLSWKMKHTRSNMHPQKPSKIILKSDSGSVRACMYVWKPSACHRKWNIHVQHTCSIFI